MNDNFIEEVKEDVRRDQILGLWSRYGNWVVSIFIGILSFITIYLFWHNYQQNKLHSQTLLYERFAQQLSSGLEGDLSEVVNTYSGGYKLLGIFEAVKSGKNSKLLDNIVKDHSFSSFYRELALIKSVLSKINSNNRLSILEQLSKIPTNSLLYSYALELKALVHLKFNNKDQSRDIWLSILKGKNFSDGSKLRAKALMDTV